MSSTCSDDSSFDEEAFEWNKYLMVRNAEEVPDDFFYHICKSEQNGIELGSVVEVENEDQSGYWFASVCSSKGVLINLHYFGDDNDKHDFWLEVKSSRIHSLNWGSENNKKLIPPYPDRFLRVNPETIKEKVQICEHVISNAVLQMGGAPIYNIFKPGMFVEVQDKEYPYRVWVSKVLQNVGGRLCLKMEGESSPEKQSFWLFFMNDRIFPFGWAEQKGLPWRVMNLDIMNSVIDSTSLLNVLKPKTPEQHTYKVGEMLEVINPNSLMVFYVGTIVKIYDNRYFKVEVDNDSDISKRITFVATKENPYIFGPGWASKHRCLLKPPSDWTTTNSFCWSKYVSMKNSKLANVDSTCRKQIDSVHVGMKLEAVDPLDPSCIRVATVKGFADRWMFLSFDRTSWCQEILHVRSVYSDDVFPVGWCNKHKYSLSTPKLPFSDCDDYKNCYYVSDVEIDFDELDSEDIILKYPNYFIGDVHYHFSNKSTRSFADSLNESIEHILNDDCVESSNDSKTVNNKINVDVKVESPELDEEFHDALFSEEENAKNSSEKESNVGTVKKEMHSAIEEENLSTIKKTLHTESYKICIYFNKNCKPGSHIVRKKITELPDSIGPGPVLNVLQKSITILINSFYFPVTSLKKIKNNENILFEDLTGVPILITTNQTKTRSSYSEFLILPESKKMSRRYCSALCNFYGMCEYFMTTKRTPCPNGCSVKESTCVKLKYNIDAMSSINMKTTKRKLETIDNFDDLFEMHIAINKKIAKVAEKHLDWTNISLVQRYKYYLACVVHYEAHIMRLHQSSPNKLILVKDILSKKHCLKMMDGVDDYKNTKSGFKNIIDKNEKTFLFMVDWKFSFENHYQSDPRFMKVKINIGDYEKIKITSNPKYWAPEDVFKYLSSDQNCNDVAKILIDEEVDGVAFMILTEEQLLHHLQCPINLAIRIMCHVAEAKYICFTEYLGH